jgi:hypothetical protein
VSSIRNIRGVEIKKSAAMRENEEFPSGVVQYR